MFEVVIPFRPRATWDSVPDLIRVVESLTVPYVISHFGGEVDQRIQYLNIHHTPTDAPWNRARALNLGASVVATEFVMPNDADCIWEEDMQERISEVFSRGNAPSLGVIYHGEINQNGFGMTGWSKSWPVMWDEMYEGYGREDIDFKTQLEKKGITIERIEGGVRHLSHQAENYPDLWKKNKQLFNQKWSNK